MAYHVHALAETVENMKHIVSFDEDMTVDKRNLLSAAYKSVIGARCESWRIVSPIEQEEESKGHEAQVSMMGYRERIEMQLQAICQDILEVSRQGPYPFSGFGRVEGVLPQAVSLRISHIMLRANFSLHIQDM